MVGRLSVSRKIFVRFNYFFLALFCCLCILPFFHVLALSLSSNNAAATGEVGLLPVGFTLKSYTFVLQKPEFIAALLVSFKRVIFGTALSLFITVLTAYPLSKANRDFRLRTVYVWFFVFTMLFGGGLVPTYMLVSVLGLTNNLAALVIPSALNVFNIVLMLNFFRNLPKAIEESAFMDGAGHWTVLWRIYIPMSMPSIATISLFTVVFHWNSWFDGFIYISSPSGYPLQTYLQTLVIQNDSKIMTKATAELLRLISDRTVKSAQVFIGAIPMLVLYPFLQRYFMAGMVLGSVKE